MVLPSPFCEREPLSQVMDAGSISAAKLLAHGARGEMVSSGCLLCECGRSEQKIRERGNHVCAMHAAKKAIFRLHGGGIVAQGTREAESRAMETALHGFHRNGCAFGFGENGARFFGGKFLDIAKQQDFAIGHGECFKGFSHGESRLGVFCVRVFPSRGPGVTRFLLGRP
jgi:hypothetical protein